MGRPHAMNFDADDLLLPDELAALVGRRAAHPKNGSADPDADARKPVVTPLQDHPNVALLLEADADMVEGYAVFRIKAALDRAAADAAPLDPPRRFVDISLLRL